MLYTNSKNKGKDMKKTQSPFFIQTFIATIVVMLLAPLLDSGQYLNLFWLICFSGIILWTIQRLGRGYQDLIVGLMFAIPFIAFSALSVINDSLPLLMVSKVFLCMFVIFSMLIIGYDIIRKPIIDTNFLFGSIMIYLLAGILWSRFYWIGDVIAPGATFTTLAPLDFQTISVAGSAIADGINNQFLLFYYSFNTLALIGLGDVIPLDYMGKALTVSESIFGRLFLAIVISKLVSVWNDGHGNNTLFNAQQAYDPETVSGRRSFLIDFAIIFLIVVIIPLFVQGSLSHAIFQVLYCVFIVVTLNFIKDRALGFKIGVILGAPYILISLVNIFHDSVMSIAISSLLISAFLFYSIIMLTRKILRNPHIDTGLVLGTIMIYMLAGLLWGNLYWATDILMEDSFKGVAHADIHHGSLQESILNANDFFYYSFTTLASFGGGYILPISNAAKAMTLLEAFFGQLFVAIAIAKMVSAWIGRKHHIASTHTGLQLKGGVDLQNRE